jgi:CDGSH-type Zn-finger protein
VLRDGRFRIRAYPGGPLLVTGADEIQGSDGTSVWCERATVALCRCGKSRLGTFCDGTHRFLPA